MSAVLSLTRLSGYQTVLVMTQWIRRLEIESVEAGAE